MTSPWCQGSVPAVPSSGSLPAGDWFVSLTCSFEAALPCCPCGTVPAPRAWGAPCGAAPGSPWRAQAAPLGAGLAQGQDRARSRERSQGSAQELPPVLQPRGRGREPRKGREKWECSGTLPHGPAGCPACTAAPRLHPTAGCCSWNGAGNPREPSRPCPSCSSHPGPLSGQEWGWRLGSPQETGKSLVSLVSPVSPVPTRLQPCANQTPITAGFG